MRLDIDISKFMYDYSNGTSEEDSPTMLKLIFDRVNPSTRIGVKNLETKLKQTSRNEFNGNVIDMLDKIQRLYGEILEKLSKS